MDAEKPIRICLTVDVESDYGRSDRYDILDRVAPFFEWLGRENVPLTAFVTGRLLERGHAIIDSFQSAGVPIGVHGFEHSTENFGTMNTSHADEIQRGVEAYVKRIGRAPVGYRAPLGIVSRNDIELLGKLGLRYDASIFPVRRPGRFDFSALPRTPFRWEGTGLVEMPFGMLTRSVPAGMSFINLIGAPAAARLLRQSAVVDIHFHNLFTHTPSMRGLPAGLRMMYLAGAWMNGFPCLQSLVSKLRNAGAVFGCLETDALALQADALPSVNFDRAG